MHTHTHKTKQKRGRKRRKIVYIYRIEILPAEKCWSRPAQRKWVLFKPKNAIRDNQQVNNTLANTLVPRKEECQLSTQVLRTEQILWASEKQVITSASSSRTFSKAKKLWNSSQLQKAPAREKCFDNHIPKVALWVGLASAPLPHPFFQWVLGGGWGDRSHKGWHVCPASARLAACPQEGRYHAQPSRGTQGALLQ